MNTPDKQNYKFCPYCGLSLGVITEEKHARKYCSHCHWTHYPSGDQASVGMIVRNHQVALVKRNREPYKDTWNFPAGFVEYGEHPESTIKREATEEVNLTVTALSLVKFIQSNEDKRSPGQLIFFYELRTTGKLNNNDQEENSEVGWFNINSPPPLGWPAHKEMMKWLQAKYPPKNS